MLTVGRINFGAGKMAAMNALQYFNRQDREEIVLKELMKKKDEEKMEQEVLDETKEILHKALQAFKIFESESIGDFFYNIRDRELKGLDGPRVKAWGNASMICSKIIAPIEELLEKLEKE